MLTLPATGTDGVWVRRHGSRHARVTIPDLARRWRLVASPNMFCDAVMDVGSSLTARIGLCSGQGYGRPPSTHLTDMSHEIVATDSLSNVMLNIDHELYQQ
jgi:hypothetical protein